MDVVEGGACQGQPHSQLQPHTQLVCYTESGALVENMWQEGWRTDEILAVGGVR